MKKIDYLKTIILEILLSLIPAKIKKYHKTKINKEIYKTIVSKTIIAKSPQQTLKKIEQVINKKIPGAYLRFGDGDIYLADGYNDSYQPFNSTLKKEMEEALEIKGEGIIKCLMIHSKKYGFPKQNNNTLFCLKDSVADKILEKAYPYFVGHEIYSPIALHYMATFNENYATKFLLFLKRKTEIFIGNENYSENFIKKNFGDAIFIKTPSRNAYTKIDIIENETIRHIKKLSPNYITVTIAMGCSGRVLAKRLLKHKINAFIFDYGSLLDALNNNRSRTWIKKMPDNHFSNLFKTISNE